MNYKLEIDRTKKYHNGFGSVSFFRPTGKWRAFYRVYDYDKQKNVQKNKSFNTFEKAKEFIDIIAFRKLNGDQEEDINLDTVLKSIIQRKYELGIIGEAQYFRLMQNMKIVEKAPFAYTNIELITSDDIQSFLNSLRHHYSDTTLSHFMNLLKQGFDRALQKGYIKQNPLVDVIRPKSSKETKIVRALEVSEQQKLSEYLFSKPVKEELYKNIFLIQMYMGLRIGETLALNISDIDFDKKILKVNKTITKDKDCKDVLKNSTKTQAGMREVPIPEPLIKTLKEQIEYANWRESSLLFPGINGNKYMNVQGANHELKKISKALGLTRITTHMLRHTFGTRCMEAGMRAVALQRIMGHSDIGITLNTYTSVFNRYKQEELEGVNDYYKMNNLLPQENSKNSLKTLSKKKESDKDI